ncbi:hypothetical protein K461DRAFT_268639 [Myriangium duriaei CBS 260.36]|uniref:Rhodopsin domain-containing protein n=1 Tax=Myriangium duriaei CBS 260.36 TaxID=1168546 RepID=A0A9P4MK41_9PEZI|nr:hypothetical protein K461DRAFT_268639 [Myriangium duriaei CBS 260.36]
MGASNPPVPHDGIHNRPTLLYSWWCTIFASLLILARLAARKIRIDKLFFEDKIMAATIIPLFIRMGCIHVVLNKGTNNVDSSSLNAGQIADREVGSKVVLAARVFFSISQGATLEFILRNFAKGSNRTRRLLFMIARSYFGISLLISIFTVLFGCHPITEAWQVVPTPNAVCREGFPGLVSTGAFLIITNVASVIYPIYVVSGLRLPSGRKAVLMVLFSAPLALVVVTSIRLPSVINRFGDQQYRSVWASTELLTEIFTGNMLILGSYARGTGAKKVKYYGGKSDPRSNLSQGRGRLTTGKDQTVHEDEEKLANAAVVTEITTSHSPTRIWRIRNADGTTQNSDIGQALGTLGLCGVPPTVAGSAQNMWLAQPTTDEWELAALSISTVSVKWYSLVAARLDLDSKSDAWE